MRSDSTIGDRFRVELIAVGIALILGICALLNYAPITISSKDEAGTAVMPQQLGQSDVLLILPDSTETAASWPQMDFSFAWYNLLSQYVGPFSISLVRDIQSSSSLQAHLIVVPQKTAEMMTDAQIQLVYQAVQLGANLLIEMPSPEWSSLTAIKRRAKVSTAIKHFTDAPNSPLQGVWRDQMLNTPIDSQVMRLDALDSETLATDALLLELDGAIAHYRRNAGAGYVFVLAFNLGQIVTAMQQGRPGDNFSIETDEVPSTSDFILSEKLRKNTIPYADLIKMHVLGSVAYASPMPMIWPYPDGYRSALLISHETGNLSDEAFNLAEYERKQSIQSTWLVTASRISKETLETWRNRAFDVGVSFLRPPVGRIYKKYGPSFFKPVVVESNIVSQKKTVSNRLGNPLSTCKFASSLWTKDYTTPFRYLSRAKCQIDVSYAPTHPEQYGYLFGSGFPFLPLERNGLPMPTYEFPTIVNDESGLETLPDNIAGQILKESETTYHEPILVNFNANTMLEHPSHLSPQTWMGLIKQAADNGIWTTTVKNFMHHYTLRKQARMHYSFSPQTRVLNVQTAIPDAPFNFTIAIPRKSLHGSLHALWLDKTSSDLTVLKTTGDGLFVLLPVSGGEHLVQAQYN